MIARRNVLASLLASSLAGLASTTLAAQTPTTPPGPHTLPPLPYAFDALEPYIDAQTMQIHHDRHHAAYVSNLNNALASFPELAQRPVEGLLRDLGAIPESVRTAVRNNGGGHANHTLFWQALAKEGPRQPVGELAKAMDARFGNFGAFQDQLTRAAMSVFGSGWAWLTVGPDRQLAIVPTSNQDTPLSAGHTPLLGLDVWEHAYYLKYQNRRADYVAALHNVINWDFVSSRYSQLMK